VLTKTIKRPRFSIKSTSLAMLVSPTNRKCVLDPFTCVLEAYLGTVFNAIFNNLSKSYIIRLELSMHYIYKTTTYIAAKVVTIA
jgi:hypothetical protein